MKINKIKFLGVMLFITVLMDVVPMIGFIAVGNISVTTMHVPTLLTSILLGPWYGVITSLMFGAVSLLRAFSRESVPLDELFLNPLVSLLPRIAVAIVTGYLYRFMAKHSQKQIKPISVMIASMVGTLANTVFVMIALAVIYPQQLILTFHLTHASQLGRALWQNVESNLIVEMMIAVVCCLIGVYMTDQIVNRAGDKKKESQKDPNGL